MVMGDVRCTGLWTSGEFHVGGTIDAKELVFGTYNDNTLFASRLRCPLVVSDDHDIQAEEEEVVHMLDRPGEEELARWMRALLDDDNRVEPSKMAQRVRDGLPLYTNPSKKAKNKDEQEDSKEEAREEAAEEKEDEKENDKEEE